MPKKTHIQDFKKLLDRFVRVKFYGQVYYSFSLVNVPFYNKRKDVGPFCVEIRIQHCHFPKPSTTKISEYFC